MRGTSFRENYKDNNKEIDMRLFRLLLNVTLMLGAISTMSCEKPAPLPSDEHVAVTYYNIDGCWELSQLNGQPLQEDTYLYIEFSRSDRSYQMWDNLNSMYGVCTTGTFYITEEEDGTYTLMGNYDHGAGEWSSNYKVEMFDIDCMQWRSTTGECLDFRRIASIPEIN